ncbi:MAG: glycosyltransferase family 2 protein [Bacteroidota bacterium]|nr:glycosyltransferase family 2 protein [Bacteroidota bacterium]
MPLVSVIITNRNYGRYVQEALRSVREQTVSDLECWVVDDGSTDDSLERLACAFDVHLIRLEGRGQGAALNAAFELSRGEWVFLLDADDLWYPQKLGRSLEALTQHPEWGAIQHRLRVIDEAGSPRKTRVPLGPISGGRLDARRVFAMDYHLAPTSGWGIRRDLWERIGPIPEEIFRLRADYYLQVLLAMTTEIGALEEELGAYRIHERNGYSGRFSSARLTLEEYIVSRFQAFLKARFGGAWPLEGHFGYTCACVYRLRRSGRLRQAIQMAVRFARAKWPQAAREGRVALRIGLLLMLALSPSTGVRLADWAVRRTFGR